MRPAITFTLKCFLMATCCVLPLNAVASDSYIGKNINDVISTDHISYLSKDQLVQVISGKTVVAESKQTVPNGKYLIRTYEADGKYTFSSHMKSNDTQMFAGDGKWWVEDDGMFCIEVNKRGKWCNKKVVKVDNTYLNVIVDNGIVFASWKIKE